MKRVYISGGFDPLHSGHLKLIEHAKTLGDHLTVILNTDDWLTRKKGTYFLPSYERRRVLNSIKGVDAVFSAMDDDDTVIKNLEFFKSKYPDDILIFANGGDRGNGNVPEENISKIIFIYEIGGQEKHTSSSSILKNYLERAKKWEFFNDRI